MFVRKLGLRIAVWWKQIVMEVELLCFGKEIIQLKLRAHVKTLLMLKSMWSRWVGGDTQGFMVIRRDKEDMSHGIFFSHGF